MPTWWRQRSATERPTADPGNPLLLGGDDGEAASPRTPPPLLLQPFHHQPRPLSFRLRALGAAFRTTNACLAAAGAAAVVSTYTLVRAVAPIPPGPAIIALASIGVASVLTGVAAAAFRSSTSPAGLSHFSSAVGAVVLCELIGMAALRASGRLHLPPGLSPGRAPTVAAAVGALQVTALAVASLMMPLALRVEDAIEVEAAAGDGWASPLRWGAASVGATPARRPQRPGGLASPPSSTSPLITPPPAVDADGAAWRARMRERYGLDTNALTYDPARRAAQVLRAQGESGERGGGGAEEQGAARSCVVM